MAGEDNSPLGRHVRECPRCQAVAAQLREGQEELALALGALQPRASASEAIDATLAKRRKTLRKRAAWRWAAPLAAAAALAGVFFVGTPKGDRAGNGGFAVAPLAPLEERPIVEAPPDRNIMILSTENRSITVIWFY